MFDKIIKRDGRSVKFEVEKIAGAIQKAGHATGEFGVDISKKLTLRVLDLAIDIVGDRTPTVEEIQDIVEEVLLNSPYKKTSKAYIIYREQHAKIREITTKASLDLVDQYLRKSDWRVNENSNMGFSLQGLNNYVSSEITKTYWLNSIYPAEIRTSYLGGDFHIHDLGSLSVYCVGWDLQDLLTVGFQGAVGKVESKPAQHFRSALGQIVNFFYTLQGEAAGAQAFSNFDTLLAPFIRHDKLDYTRVKQCLQEFLFNVNVPTRVGFQSVAYDVPVIVKKNGKIHTIEIGKLIEEEFGKNRGKVIPNIDGYGKRSKDSFAVIPSGEQEVLGFDKGGKIKWLKVKSLIKHKVPEKKFMRIRTGNGVVKISRAHSLFRFNEKIEPVTPCHMKTARPNQKLNKENHILAIKKIEKNILGNKKFLDLFEIIKELPESIRRNIFVVAKNASDVFGKIKKLYRVKEFAYATGRKDRGTFYDHVENNSLPFDVYFTYADNILENVEFYIKPYEKRLYNRYLAGEKLKSFIELTAWYISEGKCSHSNIEISQRAENMQDILELLEILNLHHSIYYTYGYSSKRKEKTQTKIANIRISGLYSYILPYLAGATSKEKRIPFYVFEIEQEIRNRFLETLFKGDGSWGNGRCNYSSMSDKLLSGVSLLCVSNGWKVRAFPKSKGRAGTLLIYKNPKRESEIVFGDMEGIPTYEIEEYEYSWDWEYDISVAAETENFVGGNLILFHNTPFTNLTMDLTVPSTYKNEPVIIGGKPTKETYEDFQNEMDLLNRAFLEIMLEGDAKGRVFTFPIPTYNITKDFNWENPNIDFLWEVTAKYGLPYFSNFINSDMSPDDVRSMCCRLRLDKRELIKRGGGLFGANPQTGSIGVVTINMPRIGYLSQSKEEFRKRLVDIMELAKESLEIKRKILEKLTSENLYPYARFYLRNVKKRTGRYWSNHFSTIGLIGMNEACLNLLGKDIGSREGLEFAKEIMLFMREKLVEFQQATGQNYNLEATPAEGTSYRLARNDKEKYPDILCANEEAYGNDAEPFYTNSTQLPVDYTDDIFEALELQDELQTMYTGGTVVHLFVGEQIENPQSVKKLVRKICENFRMPYFTITPTFSVCSEHGYISGEHQLCPKCELLPQVYPKTSAGYGKS